MRIKRIIAATLLSVMGKECLHVYRNLPITADERQDADIILTKLNEYFVSRRHTMYDRYVFNSGSQKADESFDQFLTALCNLAATCDVGAFLGRNAKRSYYHWLTGPRTPRTRSLRIYANPAKGY